MSEGTAIAGMRTLDLIERIAQGQTIEEMAAQLYPNDVKKRRAFARRAYQRVGSDDRAQAQLAEIAHSMLVAAVPGVTMALIRRALRGRPDAIKLIYEASGFHNPKVDHRHSGSVELKVVMPRPPRAELDSPPAIDSTATEIT